MDLVLAHISDLHFGYADSWDKGAEAVAEALVRNPVDHVVISGDVTDRGHWEQYERFLACITPLRETTEVSVVPGNHDRLGDDVAASIMDNRRVLAAHHDGMYVVRVDSTAPHNHRYPIEGHGMLHGRDLQQLDRALDGARPGELVVVTMHHHVLPLPEESNLERLSALLSLPYTKELDMGRQVLACLHGRCDLLLHGHRHIPAQRVLFEDEDRPLWVANAGSSSELRRARIYTHRDGRLLGEPEWLEAPELPRVTATTLPVAQSTWPRVETLGA